MIAITCAQCIVSQPTNQSRSGDVPRNVSRFAWTRQGLARSPTGDAVRGIVRDEAEGRLLQFQGKSPLGVLQQIMIRSATGRPTTMMPSERIASHRRSFCNVDILATERAEGRWAVSLTRSAWLQAMCSLYDVCMKLSSIIAKVSESQTHPFAGLAFSHHCCCRQEFVYHLGRQSPKQLTLCWSRSENADKTFPWLLLCNELCGVKVTRHIYASMRFAPKRGCKPRRTWLQARKWC